MLISKKFNIEMAHRLQHHQGKCRNIHGHSYQVTLEVFGRTKDDSTRPDAGMLCDADRLKEVAVEVDRVFDHALVLDLKDPWVSHLTTGEFQRSVPSDVWLRHNPPYFTVGDTLCFQRTKLVVMNGPPTAENLARLWFRRAQSFFDDGRAIVRRVRVRETETFEAVCTSSDL